MSVVHPSYRRHTAPAGKRALFLAFSLGDEHYVIAAREIVAVIALQQVRPIPAMPFWVNGILTYRGRAIPVIDLVARLHGRIAADQMGTRIIVVRIPDLSANAADGATRLLGLIVEKALRTVSHDLGAFAEAGLAVPTARYLGPVLQEKDVWVQWIRVDDLLDAKLQALLYGSLSQEADA